MEFDHIGVPAPGRRDGMRYLESKRLWLTSPGDHPYRVEWLWYEQGSPEAELVRTVPHVAYRVDSLEEALAGHTVVAEPFDVFGEVRVGFVEVGGAPVEFVQALLPDARKPGDAPPSIRVGRPETRGSPGGSPK